MHRYLIILLFWISGYASAHEFTPTYPKMRPSHISGVMTTEMRLFNARTDVEYYEISAFDKDWEKVSIAVTTNNPIRIKHLETKMIDVYIREKDLDKAYYICSLSKLRLTGGGKTAIVTRICSKIKS